jgi:tetratricopeptide (TPR) repeat protein
LYFLWRREESKSPYQKIKKKLEDDLLKAKLDGNWRKRQEINLQLLWLKTLIDFETKSMMGQKLVEESESSLLEKLSFDDIKLPTHWNLHDFYCFPFSQEILSAFGEVMAHNEYQGTFKPDSILPVPKDQIRRSILFQFDYLNLKKPIYLIPNKDELASSLNEASFYLDSMFIDADNTALPKSGVENFFAGRSLTEQEEARSDLEDLKLIDWRTDKDWVVSSAHYIKGKEYGRAIACLLRAIQINPDNEQARRFLSIAYFSKGEQQYENGEHQEALENIRSAAQLRNMDAIKWIEQNQKN